MNERVAAIGGQVKQAFTKVKDTWTEQEPSRKRLIVLVALGIVVLAIGLVVAMSAVGNSYTVLYPNMSEDEAVSAIATLTQASIPARLNSQGQLEVPKNQENAAIGQLAIAGIPSQTLGYTIFEQGNGLTTTDYEKQQYSDNQLQNRMQDVIRAIPGVQNVYVTIHRDDSSNRVWSSGAAKSTASVKVTMEPGAALTPGQVNGIRNIVGPSSGVALDDVAVIDSYGQVLASVGSEYDDTSLGSTQDFLKRQGFEEEVESRIANKVANIISLQYPNATDYRISASAELDWDAMITESMNYTPLDETDRGVMDHEDYQALMGAGQYAEGVVGETDNTDVPVYADLNGDGEMDAVNVYRNRDFLVSYVKTQVEKDGATLKSASVGVLINGTLNNETRQTYRDLIAAATGIAVENITVQGMLTGAGGTEVTPAGQWWESLGLPWYFIYVAIGAIVVLLIVLILLAVVRSKRKKKKLLALQQAQAEEEAEAKRIQQEIEDRKKQLKSAAAADPTDTAITEEVRDFARSNPEITANLLRTWLKEGEA